jgi:hypothetical protein
MLALAALLASTLISYVTFPLLEPSQGNNPTNHTKITLRTYQSILNRVTDSRDLETFDSTKSVLKYGQMVGICALDPTREIQMQEFDAWGERLVFQKEENADAVTVTISSTAHVDRVNGHGPAMSLSVSKTLPRRKGGAS